MATKPTPIPPPAPAPAPDPAPEVDHDPVGQLTIAELDSGSRLLKTDLVNAITANTMHRWQALAIVAWLLARRVDPAARLETYRAMTSTELVQSMGLIGAADPDSPTAPTPGS